MYADVGFHERLQIKDQASDQHKRNTRTFAQLKIPAESVLMLQVSALAISESPRRPERGAATAENKMSLGAQQLQKRRGTRANLDNVRSYFLEFSTQLTRMW